MVKKMIQAGLTRFLSIGVFLVMASGAMAGDLEPAAGPDESGSAMFTLEDVYNRLDTGAPGEKRTGGYTEPASIPESTGHTIDAVMSRMPTADDTDGASPGDAAAGKTYWCLRTDGTWGPQTGTSLSCAVCTGTLSPGGRWCDQDDGTVKDMTTNLVWLQDAGWGGEGYTSHVNTINGTNAMDRASDVKSGFPNSLTDGSVEGDWRLPTKAEGLSLVTGVEPVTPSTPRAFVNVRSGFYDIYWTGSAYAEGPNYNITWFFDIYRGTVSTTVDTNSENHHVWPVRSGN